jgi:hypothetical protein
MTTLTWIICQGNNKKPGDCPVRILAALPACADVQHFLPNPCFLVRGHQISNSREQIFASIAAHPDTGTIKQYFFTVCNIPWLTGDGNKAIAGYTAMINADFTVVSRS